MNFLDEVRKGLGPIQTMGPESEFCCWGMLACFRISPVSVTVHMEIPPSVFYPEEHTKNLWCQHHLQGLCLFDGGPNVHECIVCFRSNEKHERHCMR